MNDDYCLWMGDIDPTMDESIIHNIFRFYNIYPQAIKLIKDKETNINKNYCFIYFKSIYEANRTLNKLKGKLIPNTSLTFNLNWANYLTTTNKIIYVGNLNPLVNDVSLFNFFKSKYKSVSKAKIIAENGQSKRYGFVTFKKEKDYRRSLIEMNRVNFEGTFIKVREYKKKVEEETNENNEKCKKDLKNNTNNQLEINKVINKYNNNDERLLNTNNINFNRFFTITNSINKLNWISDANPINDVCIGINHNKDTSVNSNNIWINPNILCDNFSKKINNINFNSELNSNRENNNLINKNKNNIYNINNSSENDNIINNNKANKSNIKLEILEEFDEITLKIKINESLNKMLEYYKENILVNGNKVVSKLIFYLIFV